MNDRFMADLSLQPKVHQDVLQANDFHMLKD
jgi:hypothetical protein